MKKLKRVAVYMSTLSALFVGSAQAEQCYSAIDLGTLGGAYVAAQGINDNGEVTGWAKTASDLYHAFLYSGGSMTDLGTLGGYGSSADDINNSSQVVGNSYYTGGSYPHAFLYSDGIMTDLGTLPDDHSSSAGAINDSGKVVGSSTGADHLSHAFLYSDGVMIDLGTLGGDDSWANDINNSGQVVGSSDTASGATHPFLYSDGIMTDLVSLGGDYYSGVATAINDLGQVVGRTHTADSTIHAFLYSDGIMTDLGTLVGDTYSNAHGINDNGQVVGYSKASSSDTRAFLYSEGTMTDLNSLINPMSGWTITVATDINDSGQIAAIALNADNEAHSLLLTPVSLLENFDEYDCDGDGVCNAWDLSSFCSTDNDLDGVLDHQDNCLDNGDQTLSSVFDNFEENYPRMQWRTSGDGNWKRSEGVPLLGRASAASPVLDNSEKAILELFAETEEGVVGFSYRVSSEENADFLAFYIDDELKSEWSGSIGYTSTVSDGYIPSASSDYTPVTFPISNGSHNFKWVYSKNGSISKYLDGAWIDNVFFTPTALPWEDADTDSVPDVFDNCPDLYNPNQTDYDSDGIGDLCETDNLNAFEGFESGDFSRLPWMLTGDAGWMVTTLEPFEGLFAAQAPALNHDESATMEVSVETAEGLMSFQYKVDSEENFDFLTFYIDDELQANWSGSVGYTSSSTSGYTSSIGLPYTTQVSAGMHTFTWTYQKNSSLSRGLDTAWIDNIILPYVPNIEIPGYNPGQEDSDIDDVGDICDACPETPVDDIVDFLGCSYVETDIDGDGFEGPLGDNADCDDNDPLEFPGQVWYRDLDGDGISDGTINTTSCIRPDGYYAASELISLGGDTDDDGDDMDDNWEFINGLDPNVDDAFSDLDGDGFTNLHEFLGASNPDDITDLPRLIADYDFDNDVDGEDFRSFIGEYGRIDCSSGNPCLFDINKDSRVDDIDLFLFAQDYGRTLNDPISSPL